MRRLVLLFALTSQTAYAASLDTYLTAALETNPDIAAADARYDQARAGVDIARANLLPSLSLTGGYTHNIPAVVATIPLETGPVELTITPADQLSGQARLTVPLFVPGAIASTTAAAAQRDAGDASRDNGVDQTLTAVIRAYYTAVSAKRVEAAARESDAAAQGALATAQGRYDISGASVIDLRRAQADAARAKQTLVAAGADLRDAERTLISLTGITEPPDDTNEPRALPTGDFATLARAANPTVRSAELMVEAARATAAAAAWQYAPTIAGNTQVSVTNATGFSGKSTTASAGVSFSWNLLDGGAREGRLGQARAALRESEAKLESAYRTVDDDVAAAVDAITTSEASLAAAKEGVAAASESQRLAEERFTLGELDANDLATARRDAFDAEVQVARAQANLGLAVENLRYLVGQPLIDGDTDER